MTSATLTPTEPVAPRVPAGARRFGTALNSITITMVSLVFAAALFVDLHDVIGYTAFWWALLFAFAPVLPLTAVFVWLDRLRPEPVWLLVIALAWGALVATYTALKLNGWLAEQIGDVYGATPRSAIFIAPWVEETTKAAVIFAIVYWRRHDFNAVVAGVIYGGLTGIGFAFTENIVYYGQLFQGIRNAGGESSEALHAVRDLFLWRGVEAPFIHPMFTMLTGLGIGIAVRYRHIGVRILAPVAGFCAAVLLHMGYNSVASFAAGDSLRAVYAAILLPTLFTLLAIVLVVRRHERLVIAARLNDYTAFGWLKPEHVPYIVSRSGRQQARQHVKQFGKTERRRLRAFQRTGVDLGVLRDRLVRGVAGPSELPRERELIATMRSYRGRVMLPEKTDGSASEVLAPTSSW